MGSLGKHWVSKTKGRTWEEIYGEKVKQKKELQSSIYLGEKSHSQVPRKPIPLGVGGIGTYLLLIDLAY